MKILSDGYEVLQYMYDNLISCFGNDKNTTASAFNEHFSAFKANHPFVVSIVKLFEKQLSIAPKMGAVRRYTNSLPSAYVKTVLEHVEKFTGTAEGQRIPTVVDQYVCSLFNRISSISLVELALQMGNLPDSSQFRYKDFSPGGRQQICTFDKYIEMTSLTRPHTSIQPCSPSMTAVVTMWTM